MTREETIKVLSVLKAAYPASYKGMTKEEANGTIMAWASQFMDVSADIVMVAIHQLISTSTFPPAISEVKSKLSGIYWDAWMEMNKYETFNMEKDKFYFDMKRIKDELEGRYGQGKKEMSLAELIGGMQNYLTSGTDDAPAVNAPRLKG